MWCYFVIHMALYISADFVIKETAVVSSQLRTEQDNNKHSSTLVKSNGSYIQFLQQNVLFYRDNQVHRCIGFMNFKMSRR
jgi:hypothetical protein